MISSLSSTCLKWKKKAREVGRVILSDKLASPLMFMGGGQVRQIVNHICWKKFLNTAQSASPGRLFNQKHFSTNNLINVAEVENNWNFSQVNEHGFSSVSLAKNLACLPNEVTIQNKRMVQRIRVKKKDERVFVDHVNENTWHLQDSSAVLHTLTTEDDTGINVQRVSLAKSLACLPDESSSQAHRKEQTRMELKRSIEMRIKKKVKELYLNGKFYHIMEKVIANPITLQDSYDIVRLNSNVDLKSEGDDICFASVAEHLRCGEFDIQANTIAIHGRRNKFLVLPNLKLRVIQEAFRVVLDVIYRPYFSKISHGCRSGRGRHSAMRYICHEVGKTDWWFTLPMKQSVDRSIMSNLISIMGEKIEDDLFFSIMYSMFDAQVLNLEFGGFPKGQGLPQEGVLSPILMNIYLRNLDSEIFRLFMKYEGLGLESSRAKGGTHSNLRLWFRSQVKENNSLQMIDDSGPRLHACRYMDEIFIAVSGSRETAISLKNDIQFYMKNSLSLQVEDREGIVSAEIDSCGIQFLGMVVRSSARECKAERAVHRLKDKVCLFAAHQQEVWDAAMYRIGKKWLAYGLKRIKESEIKQLGLSSPLLDEINQFRKDGMKTDHWFRSLLKIWLQDVNAKSEDSVKSVLCKYVAEPAVPQDLKDTFFNFQKCAQEYASSETASTAALLSTSSMGSSNNTIISVEIPIKFIKMELVCYGVVSTKGFPRHVSALILHDDILILLWFSGLVHRWIKWYSEYDNFKDLKAVMVDLIKISCIKTLAAKHRMHESLIEKRFELELNKFPLTEDLEIDMASIASSSESHECDEALTYGVLHSGLCMFSLSRVKVPSRPLRCFTFGCLSQCPSLYTLHVKGPEQTSGWNTGFSTGINLCLDGEKIALCNQHVKDLYLGRISHQAIEFGCLRG